MTGYEDVYDFSNGQHGVDLVLQHPEFHPLRILSWSIDAGAVSFTHWTCPLRNELIGALVALDACGKEESPLLSRIQLWHPGHPARSPEDVPYLYDG